MINLIKIQNLDQLIMVPPKDKFIEDIITNIKNISDMIVESSKVIDFKGVLRDTEKYGHKPLE